MDAALGWIGQFIYLLAQLIPRRVLIPHTHEGVKFKGCQTKILLQHGIHWYWPFRTKVHVIPVVQQNVTIPQKTLLTKDGVCVHLDGMVTYIVSNTMKAASEYWDIDQSIDDEASAIFCEFFTQKTYSEVNKSRFNINQALTKMADERLCEYGISVKRARLNTYITGKVNILLTSGTVGQTIAPLAYDEE